MNLNCIDYKIAMQLARADLPFAALLAATMARADTNNMKKLRLAFPSLAGDLQARYDAPGGVLPHEWADVADLSNQAAIIAHSYLEKIKVGRHGKRTT